MFCAVLSNGSVVCSLRRDRCEWHHELWECQGRRSCIARTRFKWELHQHRCQEHAEEEVRPIPYLLHVNPTKCAEPRSPLRKPGNASPLPLNAFDVALSAKGWSLSTNLIRHREVSHVACIKMVAFGSNHRVKPFGSSRVKSSFCSKSFRPHQQSKCPR